MSFGRRLKKFKGFTVAAIIIGLSLVAASIPSFPGFTPTNPEAQAATVTKVTLAKNTARQATPLYVIKSGKPGPVVMIVGGVHGNETSGPKAADKIKNLRPKKGTLLVLPRANIVAVQKGTRTSPGVGDMNRTFPRTKNGKCTKNTSQSIWDAIKKYDVDYLIDLHEGYNYHKIQPSSYGQTLIYYPISGSRTVGLKIINALNKGIGSPSKHFTLVKYPYQGTLARAAAQHLGVKAFTLETCRKSAQSIRVNNGVKAAKTLLNHLGML
ncbi:MAG: hypothetical protein GX052_08260 [Syntrophomonadaceae bacterium]|jgi:predicted deacylase|nr:hypothetical protein [Syntrophomonadaceae bacterium]